MTMFGYRMGLGDMMNTLGFMIDGITKGVPM